MKMRAPPYTWVRDHSRCALKDRSPTSPQLTCWYVEHCGTGSAASPHSPSAKTPTSAIVSLRLDHKWSTSHNGTATTITAPPYVPSWVLAFPTPRLKPH